MPNNNFMDKIRTFFGFNQEPPKNEFRNPIWGSDDDDDDCDELYSKQHNINVYSDPVELHREMTRHMHDMFNSFGNIFGDVKVFFPDENFQPSLEGPSEPDNLKEDNIRDYYLKPGYQNKREHNQDTDLDGQISSNDISGLFKKKDNSSSITTLSPFNEGNSSSGRSFFQTIITTSVTKPDGTVETRRIVKNQDGVVEETTTETVPTPGSPHNTNMDIIPAGNIYNNILLDLSSLLRNIY